MTRNSSKRQKKQRDLQVHCRYCGQPFHANCTRTFDHFYPLELGQNLNRSWNKFVVCHPCNHDKGNKMPQEFIQYLLNKVKNNKNQNTKYFIRVSKTVVNMLLLIEQIEPWFNAKDIL